MSKTPNVFKSGIDHIIQFARELDQRAPTTPSLSGLIVSWNAAPFPYIYHHAKKETRAKMSPQHAASEGLGLIMGLVIKTLDVLATTESENTLLQKKFQQLLEECEGGLMKLRSSTNRDVWMSLTCFNDGFERAEGSEINVGSVARWLVQNNMMPPTNCDEDNENLADYLIRYSYNSFDPVFNELKDLPFSWWETQLSQSKVFRYAKNYDFAAEVEHLYGEERSCAEHVLNHCAKLRISQELENIPKKTPRKSKI